MPGKLSGPLSRSGSSSRSPAPAKPVAQKVSLILKGQTVDVTKKALSSRTHFSDLHNAEQRSGEYRITTDTTIPILQSFVAYLEQPGEELPITADNQAALISLADEFGGELVDEVRKLCQEFQSTQSISGSGSSSFSSPQIEPSGQLAGQLNAMLAIVRAEAEAVALRESERDARISALEQLVEESRYDQNRLTKVQTDFQKLERQFEELRKNVSTTKTQIIENHRTILGELNKRVETAERSIKDALENLKNEGAKLRADGMQLRGDVAQFRADVNTQIEGAKIELSVEGQKLWAARPACVVPAPGLPLAGVFAYLKQSRGTHPVDAGLVVFAGEADKQKGLIDGTGSSLSVAGGGFLSMTLKNLRIRITHYAVQLADTAAVKGWTLNGSVDGNKFDELDEVKEAKISKVFGKGQVALFEVTTSKDCCAIKFTGSDKNKAGTLTGFEVFGMVYEGQGS
jgi:hypothetical protein